TSSGVHFRSSLLFPPDPFYRTFSSFRSIPFCYQNSTERWFTAHAYTSTVIGLLSSFVQHVLNLLLNSSRHTLRQRGLGFVVVYYSIISTSDFFSHPVVVTFCPS